MLLASLLKQHGKLIVVDLLKSEVSAHLKDAQAGPVPHKGGLSQPTMIGAFSDAGLHQIEFKPVLEITSGEKTVQLFVITGNR